jgi:hypothetical protein
MKAEMMDNMADMIKRFEAMIAEKGGETGKKTTYLTRRPQRTGKIAMAAPIPTKSASQTTSAPNIIELAANLRSPPSGLLLETEVN